MPNHQLTVLGIDPATNCTGVALVAFDAKGCPTVLARAKLIATVPPAPRTATDFDKGAACSLRIDKTARLLSAFVADLPFAIDFVAYERAFGTMAAAIEIHQATGAYLSISQLARVPKIKVYTQQVKAVCGNGRAVFAKNVDSKAKKDKRDTLKALSVVWAREVLGLVGLADHDHDISEACAVACAGWKIWYKDETLRQAKAAQKPLLGKGSGTKCEPRGASANAAALEPIK